MTAAQASETIEDYFSRRQFDREKTYLHGRLILNESCSYGCTIHNTSPGGACIELNERHYVPPHFELEFVDDGVTISCRRAWYAGTKVGAHFVSNLIAQVIR